MNKWNKRAGRASYFLLFSAVLLGAGCASTTYLPYTGQQKDWPTADAAFAKTVRGVTIYRGLPPKPYNVLGLLTVYAESDYLESTLVNAALAHGADGVIIDQRSEGPGDSSTFGGGVAGAHNGLGFASGSSYTASYPSTSLEARLIRFKDSGPVPVPAPAAVDSFPMRHQPD